LSPGCQKKTGKIPFIPIRFPSQKEVIVMGAYATSLLRLTTLFFAFVFSLGLAGHTQAQETPRSAEEIGVSVENVEKLIQTLENPEKREALLEDLRTIKALQGLQREVEAETPERETPNLVERVILEYSLIAGKVSDSFHRLVEAVQQTPEALRRANAYLGSEKNRATVYKALTVLGIGIGLAVGIVLVVRWFTAVLSRKVVLGKEGTTRGRMYEAGLRMAIRISPYAALLGGAFVVFGIWGIRGLPYRFVLLILLTLLQYEAIFQIARILVSPYDSGARVLTLPDETSAYVWIWVRRFLNLWIIYYFVTEFLMILKVSPSLYLVVRGVLIFLFPLLATVLLLQIRRTIPIKAKFLTDQPRWKRFVLLLARFWVLGAGVLVWVISIFMITQYRVGITFLVSALLKTAVAVSLLWILIQVVDRLFDRLFNVGKEIRARFPELEKKTDRYIGSLRGIAKGVVAAVGVGSILEFWGFRVSWFVTSDTGSAILSRVITVGIVVGVVMAIIDLSGFVQNLLTQSRTDPTGRVIEPGRKLKTLVPLIHWVITVAACFVGGVVVLNQVGVNVTPILAGAGIVGLAVGFGAQSLVKDFINGLFLLFEGSVAVGDVVVINGTGGLVEAVTLRTIKMRDLGGNVHVIPNGTVNMITNMTKDYSRYIFDVGVAYREDVDEVMAVLKEIGESMQSDPEYADDILEPLEIFGVDKFADSAVIIKARITTRPLKQWRVGREFNRRMKKIFDERGIEIPFPHHTIYWGEAKIGHAPPLSIQMRGEDLSRVTGENA
jgi:small conductance mechanosensitive channel